MRIKIESRAGDKWQTEYDEELSNLIEYEMSADDPHYGFRVRITADEKDKK